MRVLNIKAKSIDADTRTLSGKPAEGSDRPWLAVDVRTLILLDPTRGVDVGARAEINKIWLDLSERRVLLYVSSDADELAEVCDRVVVMRRGSKLGELSGEDLTNALCLGWRPMADEGATVDTQVKAGAVSRLDSSTSTIRARIRNGGGFHAPARFGASVNVFPLPNQRHVPHPSASAALKPQSSASRPSMQSC